MTKFRRAVGDTRPRVLVAGGGIGGVEAALALRSLAGGLPAIELITPESEFVYRAMVVAEPFGYASRPRIGFERLERSRNVHHRRDALAAVHTADRTVELASGERLAYSALVVAVGARPQPWLAGALTFSGWAAVPSMRDLLAELESGAFEELLFTAPAGTRWALPLYELALLTSAWCAERGLPAARLQLVTPEARPLDTFGPAASRLARDLLSDRGISLRTDSVVSSFDGRRAQVRDRSLPADAVIALPRLVGNPVVGLPADGDGFIPVDDHGRVVGTADVYAVGDATTHPIKQGGLAAQQADVAAATIARDLGIAVRPPSYRPVMRGILLTGVTSAFLKAAANADMATFNPLWWPPTKVAGRHVAAFLADVRADSRRHELADRPPATDMERAAHDRAEMRALALEMASADVQWDDYDSAVRWLQIVEWLDGALPADLARRRDEWRKSAGAPH